MRMLATVSMVERVREGDIPVLDPSWTCIDAKYLGCDRQHQSSLAKTWATAAALMTSLGRTRHSTYPKKGT